MPFDNERRYVEDASNLASCLVDIPELIKREELKGLDIRIAIKIAVQIVYLINAGKDIDDIYEALLPGKCYSLEEFNTITDIVLDAMMDIDGCCSRS